MFKTPEEVNKEFDSKFVVNFTNRGYVFPCVHTHDDGRTKIEDVKSHINQIRINDIEEEIKWLEDILRKGGYLMDCEEARRLGLVLDHKRSQLEVLQGSECKHTPAFVRKINGTGEGYCSSCGRKFAD